MTPEGKVKHAVKKRLRTDTWWFMPVQNGMGRVGVPDFIGCVPVLVTPDMVGQVVGQFFAVETKAPGKTGTTTANQDRELAGIHKAGGIAVVIDTADKLPVLLDERPV